LFVVFSGWNIFFNWFGFKYWWSPFYDFYDFYDFCDFYGTSDWLCLVSDGLLVTQRFFFAAWAHDILYKVGGGIVLSEALAASGLDPD
jgi:hypothetical protein